MNIGKSTLLILFVSLSYSLAEVSYEGYKLVKLLPSSDDHLKLINNLQHNHDFDIHSSVRKVNEKIDVLLSPIAYLKYKQIFDQNQLRCEIINHNVQSLIDIEKRSMEEQRNKRDAEGKIVGTYARYNEIVNYITDIASKNSYASTFDVGTTYEGKVIKGLILKTPTADRGLFIDCGIHAREWIAISSCIWTIDRLVNDYNNGSQDAVQILNKYEIHIIPVLNPDGYEYAHTTDRRWRKNRRPNPGSTCVGTDLNRNFGYFWNTAGASTNPCSEVFAGPSADSELETKALENAILAKSGYWDAYLTIHTYGNYWLSSWSHTLTFPSDITELVAKSDIGAAAMNPPVSNTNITTGNSAQLFGRLAGVSDDWAKGVAGIKYSYTLELAPGAGEADYGSTFYLPVDRAPRVGEALYQGFKAFTKSFLS